jgi:hypothetical protein
MGHFFFCECSEKGHAKVAAYGKCFPCLLDGFIGCRSAKDIDVKKAYENPTMTLFGVVTSAVGTKLPQQANPLTLRLPRSSITRSLVQLCRGVIVP